MTRNEAIELLEKEYPECVVKFKDSMKGTWLESHTDSFLEMYGKGVFLLIKLQEEEMRKNKIMLL